LPTPPASPPPVRALFRAAVDPIRAFLALEAASGILLLASAIAALAWVNLGGAESYEAVFTYRLTLGAGQALVTFSARALVNDGLMALFFFVVGMEIKRELAVGELRTRAQAALPAIAAMGGMLLPALVFLAWNAGGAGAHGWGIPMATDIAFSIGVLRLLRSRVPHALIVFVTALAIFDDIGGILVIALFYGHGIAGGWLLAAGAVTLGLVVMSRARVHHAAPYALVVVGLAIPARARTEAGTALEDLEPPLTRFIHFLHPWVAYLIMPLFALANSGVDLRRLDASQLTGAVAMGTATALVLGKLAGIFSFTALAVRARLAPMPGGVSHAKLLGVSLVAGVGFTVALFIAGLAYPSHPELLDEAKVGILGGSLLAGVAGAVLLRLTPALGATPAAD